MRNVASTEESNNVNGVRRTPSANLLRIQGFKGVNTSLYAHKYQTGHKLTSGYNYANSAPLEGLDGNGRVGLSSRMFFVDVCMTESMTRVLVKGSNEWLY